MTFRVGQEVCCIRDDWINADRLPATPKRGNVYVVESTSMGHLMGIPKLLLHFAEFKNGWSAVCFRPVQKRKTDISVFTALLNTKSEKELV